MSTTQEAERANGGELSHREAELVFEALRHGTVPSRGFLSYAVGIEGPRRELLRQLDLVKGDQGATKFLRGAYGCGKTFMARVAQAEAQAAGFATSFVVVSENDLRIDLFDQLYRALMAELGTTACPRNALGDLLDRWVSGLEDVLLAGGADPEAKDYEELLLSRLEADLQARTGQTLPQEFGRAVKMIYRWKADRRWDDAGALVSWLAGSAHVGPNLKREAQLSGNVQSEEAMRYLRGVLELTRAAGYAGIVVIVDEVETIQKKHKSVRERSLNAIRQIVDHAGEMHGLLWIFTGTPEFFDGPRGVASLPPLHDRIQFRSEGNFINLRQPQLNLPPFNEERLTKVALRLRELYPVTTLTRAQFTDRISNRFITRLIQETQKGFKRDIGVVPRAFLRYLVDVMDHVEQNPDFDPEKNYKVQAPDPEPITPTEEEGADEAW